MANHAPATHSLVSQATGLDGIPGPRMPERDLVLLLLVEMRVLTAQLNGDAPPGSDLGDLRRAFGEDTNL